MSLAGGGDAGSGGGNSVSGRGRPASRRNHLHRAGRRRFSKPCAGSSRAPRPGNRLPPEFLTRLIWAESSFRASVTSPAGAQGIAQFMPGTAQEWGLADPFDPEQAIPKAAEFLRHLRDRFGNLGLAAAAYNGGPARVAAWMEGRGGLPDETRTYVVRITGRAAEDWAAADPPQEDAGGAGRSSRLPSGRRGAPDSGPRRARAGGRLRALGRAVGRKLFEGAGAGVFRSRPPILCVDHRRRAADGDRDPLAEPGNASLLSHPRACSDPRSSRRLVRPPPSGRRRMRGPPELAHRAKSGPGFPH